MKILLDIEIKPCAVAGFIEVIKTTGELAVDASGAFCQIVNVQKEEPEKVKINL